MVIPIANPTGMIKLSDSEFLTLSTFVKQKYGINLDKKRILIEGRMTNLLRHRGFSSFNDYMEVLFKDTTGKEVSDMLNLLTTNLSFFMREPEHYDYLKKIILPNIIKNKKDHDVRIWSAGCSAGQEAYTTAMVIDEFFGNQKRFWDTTILATDISMKVLDIAKQGIYQEMDIKDIPLEWKNKYFVDIGNGNYQVCEKIRKEVVFKQFNLMEHITVKKPMDLIFCRNVMIYFDAPTKNKLVEKFYNVTAEGGHLFIGHSESINKDCTKYRYIKPAIYQKIERV